MKGKRGIAFRRGPSLKGLALYLCIDAGRAVLFLSRDRAHTTANWEKSGRKYNIFQSPVSVALDVESRWGCTVANLIRKGQALAAMLGVPLYNDMFERDRLEERTKT